MGPVPSVVSFEKDWDADGSGHCPWTPVAGYLKGHQKESNHFRDIEEQPPILLTLRAGPSNLRLALFPKSEAYPHSKCPKIGAFLTLNVHFESSIRAPLRGSNLPLSKPEMNRVYPKPSICICPDPRQPSPRQQPDLPGGA